MDPVSKVVGALVSDRYVRQATVFLDTERVVKATRRLYNGRPQRASGRSETFLITFGKPNYREREFIKACRKAGEPLPVKKVQLRFVPKK